MEKSRNISAYILCGGLSSRMKEEKGLVNFNTKPFVAYSIDAVAPFCGHIVLVSNTTKYKKFGCKVIEDTYKLKGPVGGIHAALQDSQTDYTLILSCDMPMITASLIENYLMNNELKSDVIYLGNKERDYPLIGLYKTSLASRFEDAIKKSQLKLMTLINQYDAKRIEVNAADSLYLSNINTKQELETLKQMRLC